MRLWTATVIVGTQLMVIPPARAQDVIPPVIQRMPGGFDGQNFPSGTFLQIGTALGETKYFQIDAGTTVSNSNIALWDYEHSALADRWNWEGTYQYVSGSDHGVGYDLYRIRLHRIVVFVPGMESLGTIRVGIGSSPTNIPTESIPYDGRPPEAIADAPKVNFDPHDGYLIMSPVLGPSLMQIMGSGRVTDPNGPLNLNGLELQYDENGVRKSRPIELNPDGTFKFRFKDLIGDGVNGRPLIFYRRTNGDNVNVCYYGTAQQLEKRKELKEFRYDNLRHKISEAVKASGHFRYIRTNGVTMGVRG